MRTPARRRTTGAEPIIGEGVLISAVVGYLIVVTITMVIVGVVDRMGPYFWGGTAIALACYGGAFATVLAPPPGALGRWAAIGATALVVAAQTATWSAAVLDKAPTVVVYEPLVVTAYGVYVTIIFRNHLVVAWCGFFVGLFATLTLGPHTGASGWWTALQSTSVVALLVVTAVSLASMPLLGEIDALALRRRRLTADHDVEQVAVARREERLERIDRRVRPVLEQIVASGQVGDDDVRFARLTEARLRDGIRARAFDTELMREAVWGARARGVSVTLLDDGGLRELSEADATTFLSELIPLLRAELDALDDGELIARISPPRRTPIAMVTVVLRGTRRRVEFGTDGRVTRVVQL